MSHLFRKLTAATLAVRALARVGGAAGARDVLNPGGVVTAATGPDTIGFLGGVEEGGALESAFNAVNINPDPTQANTALTGFFRAGVLLGGGFLDFYFQV